MQLSFANLSRPKSSSQGQTQKQDVSAHGVVDRAPARYARYRRFTFADFCVLTAMVLVAGALGTGLVVHGGISPVYAGLAGLLVWMSVVSGHFLIRRESVMVGLANEMTRLQQEVLRLGLTSVDAGQSSGASGREAPKVANVHPVQDIALHQQAPKDKSSGDLKSDTSLTDAPPSVPRYRDSETTGLDAKAPLTGQVTQRKSSSVDNNERLGNLESYVPNRAGLLDRDRAIEEALASGPVDRREDPERAVVADQDAAQKIDSIIKRLANDIVSGQRGIDMPVNEAVPEVGTSLKPEVSFSSLKVEDFFGLPPLPEAAAVAHSQSVPEKVRERAPERVTETKCQPVAKSVDTGVAPMASGKIAAIADALTNEKLDVFLEPILGLADQKARHYEVSIRLRLDDGEIMDQATYSEVTRGTGLLPLIDAVKISHTKRIAVELSGRGRSGAFFSQVNGEALETSQFGNDVRTITKSDPAMAARLVLSFSQNDVRGFAQAEWNSLEGLKGLGFRFALEDVTDLDMDFDLLSHRGFVFAKLDASVFVAGLPAPEGHIPAPDICQHLAGAGLTLIVQSLEDDRQLAEVLGFGVLFGQGNMFGGPRPVKPHVLRGSPDSEMRLLA